MESIFDLNSLWFGLVGVLLAGYAVLDGFDLGVGILHLRAGSDEERRVLLNAIGPVWDGNEVWLVTGGGALFAGFPMVYATVFSGFYTAFMLLLVALIFRAVAIEFRSKRPGHTWRTAWDVAFSLASLFIALLMGIALGNVITGIAIGADGEYRGGLLPMITPYTLLVGLTTVAMFTMHGAIYLTMKTEGKLLEKVAAWVPKAIIFAVVMYGVTTIATLVFHPAMTAPFKVNPWLFAIPLMTLLAIANVPRQIFHGRHFLAFLSSSAAIASLLALVAVGLYPNIVVSTVDPAYSLTVHNASSSPRTLQIMLTMALIGVPFVLAYTVSIYWIFRGRVQLDAMSY